MKCPGPEVVRSQESVGEGKMGRTPICEREVECLFWGDPKALMGTDPI